MLPQLYGIVSWIFVGVSLSLGIGFLLIHIPPSDSFGNYRIARKIVAYAYIVLGLATLFEQLATSGYEADIRLKQVLTLFIGSIQALLFAYTLITLVETQFVTLRKILIQLVPILILSALLFTAMASGSQSFFDTVCLIFITYYILMLTGNILLVCSRYMQYKRQVDNYFSDQEADRLQWVKTAFIFAIFIGTMALVSTIVKTVFFFTLFVCTYLLFYLYFGIQFINYAFLFHEIRAVVEPETAGETAPSVTHSQLDTCIEQWVKNKGFTTHGITIEQMAAGIGTNRTYLSNYINTYEQQTFKEWITALRIEEAKELLLMYPDRTASEIGRQAGFSDRSNFGRCFHKYTGSTPQVWRKKSKY